MNNKNIKIDKLIPKAKKFILDRKQAIIVIKQREYKPILRSSEIFNKEYEKEKNLLGWK
jgi:hypothetical protein